MRRLLVRPGLAAVGGFVAALPVGGIAHATTPDSNGVIHTGSGYELANGAADLSVFTATTLTRGGSVVEMDCDAQDFTTIAQSGNLMLFPVASLS